MNPFKRHRPFLGVFCLIFVISGTIQHLWFCNKDAASDDRLSLNDKHSTSHMQNLLNFSVNFTTMGDIIPGFPHETNKRISSLSRMSDIIEESQHLHFLLFSKLIGHYRYVILVDLAMHENKGDAAIDIGEFTLLRKLQKEILFWCTTDHCTPDELIKARKDALKYGINNVVVLSHGGGNLIGYPRYDKLRETIFTVFNHFKIIVLPQSIWIKPDKSSHLEYCRRMYARFPNVTFMIRDELSLQRAKQYLSHNTVILTPDSAFHIGKVPRTIRPHYDIVWIKRSDGESSRYNTSHLHHPNVTVQIADWLEWLPSNLVSNYIEKMDVITLNGFLFLQRGRVVVTDRLHGHIMATLLQIPHVLMDTSDHKLQAYHNTWTYGLEGESVLTAQSPQDAIDKAQILLKKFHNKLPKVTSINDWYIYP